MTLLEKIKEMEVSWMQENDHVIKSIILENSYREEFIAEVLEISFEEAIIEDLKYWGDYIVAFTSAPVGIVLC